MHIQKLVLEVTRKCNMNCSHCLRGDAQNINMCDDTIDSLLDQVKSIGYVTFTGGEPTLNLKSMQYFLNEVKDRDIEVESFFIVTNGLKITKPFIEFCKEMYNYCTYESGCGVEISNDYFHLIEGNYNKKLLHELPFVSLRYKESEIIPLLAEGRAVDDYNALPVTEYLITDIESFYQTSIYINCNGDVIRGCNWSYESQAKDKHIICAVENLKEYYETIPN